MIFLVEGGSSAEIFLAEGHRKSKYSWGAIDEFTVKTEPNRQKMWPLRSLRDSFLMAEAE